MDNASKWFKGVRGKLLSLVALPILILLGLSYFSVTEFASLTGDLKEANFVRLPLAQLSGEMTTDSQAIRRWLWSAQASDGDAAARRMGLEHARQAIASFDENRKEYEALPRSEKSRELYKVVENSWPTARATSLEVANLIEHGDHAAVDQAEVLIRTKLREAFQPIEDSFDKLNDLRLATSKQEAEATIANSARVRSWLVGAAGLSGVLLVIMGLLIASSLAGVLTRVAGSLGESSAQVSNAGHQISSASQQLSSSSTEAAASLEETVSSLEELSSMVKLSADNAKEAASLSQASRGSAEDGEKEIRQLINSMEDIAQSSKKIEEIINVIDDIAFQTNLLALNAAVEAARAGEQGKGFAVVAEAVRNLAQRSATAAKDITTLIKESVSKTDRGAKIAEQSGAVLKNIVASVKKVADLNGEIASASQEQSSGISQITKAMNQLDQTTQTNAASAEETAAASEEMSAQAVTLERLVGELQAVLDGARSSGGSYAGASSVASAAAPVVALASRRTRPIATARANGAAPSHGAFDAKRVLPFEGEPAAGKVGTTDGF